MDVRVIKQNCNCVSSDESYKVCPEIDANKTFFFAKFCRFLTQISGNIFTLRFECQGCFEICEVGW